jgi:hypothetical protein
MYMKSNVTSGTYRNAMNKQLVEFTILGLVLIP